jgi:aspartyl-tRNA(Asn)/glutamyl-tRNA(Gln) amidotransferase subunit A
LSDVDLGYLGIADLGGKLADHSLSPVELCRALLRRCERLEPTLNAFITLDPERILEEARAAERELAAGRPRSPLHGVPVAVKDLCWTRRQRTTGGSKVLVCVPEEDASVVARLRAAGAIIFGKSNTPEFAYGPLNAYHYGPSRNPWDPTRFTGGSSMGAAAVLAGGLAPGALGSDTGGSIRGPAHWSGVTGLMPTYGRVPLRGVVALATTLDHVGPMTRSALDAALLLQPMAGYDPLDPTSVDAPVPDYARDTARPLRPLRIGVIRGAYLWDLLAPAIGKAVETALGELRRLGPSVEDVELPEWEGAADASPILIRVEAATEYRRTLAERPGDLIPEVRERLEAGTRTSAIEYLDARRASDRFAFALRRLFTRVDLLALPGRAQTAPKMDESGRLLEPLSPRNYTSPLNYPGVPALTFPCGFDGEGLPIGIQLVAPHWGESALLNVAHAYQQVTDWHRRRPPLCA